MVAKKFIDPHGLKVCCACEKTLPATTEYFHRNARTLTGLNVYCKICDNKRRTQADKEKRYHNLPRHCITCGKFFYTSRAYINKAKRLSKNQEFVGKHCSFACVKKNPNNAWNRKGRSWNGQRAGFNNPNSKYNIDQIREIKRLIINNEKASVIQQLTGMKRSSIYLIKSGKRYADITI